MWDVAMTGRPSPSPEAGRSRRRGGFTRGPAAPHITLKALNCFEIQLPELSLGS